MKQYISIDDNSEDYFVVLLNTVSTDNYGVPIYTFETVATINKERKNEY